MWTVPLFCTITSAVLYVLPRVASAAAELGLNVKTAFLICDLVIGRLQLSYYRLLFRLRRFSQLGTETDDRILSGWSSLAQERR
jgi:hypothetical protein